MNITVIGLGYLGTTHAVAMAQLGHDVIGIEPNAARVAELEAGRLPFYEPGLQDALTAAIGSGRLSFATAHGESSKTAAVHFLCVGTPQSAGSNQADTSYLYSAVEALIPVLSEDAVIAGKSTVPVGTAAELAEHASKLAGHPVHLAWNPEFLREGTALQDSLAPDRIVLGITDAHSEAVMREFYAPITATGTPLLTTDLPTSELVKVAANSFLATKISFINAVAEVAEAAGADAVKLAEAIGLDERIGSKFLRNGVGYGGGCLPKDVRAFIARAEDLGVSSAADFLHDVEAINARRRERVVTLAQQTLGGVSGKRILILGAAFKPDTDDLRESAALDIAKQLADLGAKVVVHDPMALPALVRQHPQWAGDQDVFAAAAGAELVILATEWKQYRELDPSELGTKVSAKNVIDGRNLLDIARWQAAGWHVDALGRNIKNG